MKVIVQRINIFFYICKMLLHYNFKLGMIRMGILDRNKEKVNIWKKEIFKILNRLNMFVLQIESEIL